MRTIPFILTSVAIASINLVSSQHSISAKDLAQLGDFGNIGEITTSVLDRLGYECDDVAGVGIVCKKCEANSIITEKCTAYICDAATRKCRRKEGTIPKLPDSED